jgi:hypothetical protein
MSTYAGEGARRMDQAVSTVQAAISAIASSLEHDGYYVQVSALPDKGEGAVLVEIAAGEDACSDCLVPKLVFESIVSSELADRERFPHADAIGVYIRYPGES